MSSWIPLAIDQFLYSPLWQNLKTISLFLVIFSSHSLFNPLVSYSESLDSWLWPHDDTKTFSRYQRPPFYQIQWSVLDVSLFDFSAVFPTADHCLFKCFIHLASRLNFSLVCLHLTWRPIFITLLSFSRFHPWHLWCLGFGCWPFLFPLSFSIFCLLYPPFLSNVILFPLILHSRSMLIELSVKIKMFCICAVH